MVASDRGIGYVILSSTSRLDTPLAFSCLLLLALTTFAISKTLGLIERRVVRWAYRANL
jgi:NitT/TauT family transport system permease protein